MSKYRFGFDFFPEPVGGGDSGGSGGSQTATPVGYVDQITDKNGDLYDIHDTGARSSIATVSNSKAGFIPLRFNCNDYEVDTDVYSAGMAQQSYWHDLFLKILRTNLYNNGQNNTDTVWAVVRVTHRIYDGGYVTNETTWCYRVPVSFSDCRTNSSTATSGTIQLYFIAYNPFTYKWSKVVDTVTIGSATDGSGDTHSITYSELAPSASGGPNTYVIEYNRTQTNHSVVSINGKTSTSDKITELRNLIADCTSTTQPIVCINYLDTSTSTTNAIRVRVNANVSPITANDVGFEFITTVFPSSGADVPSSAKYNQIRLTISGSNISDYFSSKTVSLS